MINLQNIEEKYGIIYPKIYKELYDSKMLSWGELGQNWIRNEYPILKKKPPFLLYANDFNIISFDSIEDKIQAFKDPEDYRQTDTKFNFIPFATNGAGDLYCFQFDNIQNDDVPVVLVWHDMNCVNVLSKNIQDFIFRSMLESLIDYDPKYSLISEGNLFNNLNNFLNTHKVFLTQHQRKIVQNWYGKIPYDKNNLNVLVSEKDTTKIENQILDEIKFVNLNSEFEYQLEKQAIEITENNKRRVGTLSLKVALHSKLSEKTITLLKTLNWRKNKSKNSEFLEYYRKNTVFFGVPMMDTLGDTYNSKLIELKQECPNNLTLSFLEYETDKLFKL